MTTGNMLFKPKAFSARGATDDKRNHGRIVNPPRMGHLGGLTSTGAKGGVYKNEMTLKKPGGTK